MATEGIDMAVRPQADVPHNPPHWLVFSVDGCGVVPLRLTPMPTPDEALNPEPTSTESVDAEIARLESEVAGAALALSETPDQPVEPTPEPEPIAAAPGVVDPVVEPPVSRSEVAELKAQIATLMEVVKGQAQRASPVAEPTKPAETDADPQPGEKATSVEWVNWMARQEARKLMAPLLAELKDLRTRVGGVDDLVAERTNVANFNAAAAKLGAENKSFLNKDFNGKVAARIGGNEALFNLFRASPEQAIRLAGEMQSTADKADAAEATLTKIRTANTARTTAAPPRGAGSGSGARIVPAANSLGEAWEQAVAEFRRETQPVN